MYVVIENQNQFPHFCNATRIDSHSSFKNYRIDFLKPICTISENWKIDSTCLKQA